MSLHLFFLLVWVLSVWEYGVSIIDSLRFNLVRVFSSRVVYPFDSCIQVLCDRYPDLFVGLFLIFQGQQTNLFFIIIRVWLASLVLFFIVLYIIIIIIIIICSLEITQFTLEILL